MNVLMESTTKNIHIKYEHQIFTSTVFQTKKLNAKKKETNIK